MGNLFVLTGPRRQETGKLLEGSGYTVLQSITGNNVKELLEAQKFREVRALTIPGSVFVIGPSAIDYFRVLSNSGVGNTRADEFQYWKVIGGYSGIFEIPQDGCIYRQVRYIRDCVDGFVIKEKGQK